MIEFSLQKTTGTFSKGECLSSNHLFTAMMVKPEIFEDLMLAYPAYSLSAITYGLGNYGKEGKVRPMTHHQRGFEWGLRGRLQRRVTWVRHVSGTGTGGFGEVIAVAASNWLNPKDSIRFANGQQLSVLGKPTQVADGWQYRMRFNAQSSTEVFVTSQFAGGKSGTIGNVFENGSERGFSNVVTPDIYKQWSTISRRGISWDNEGILTVVWFKGTNGESMWALEEQAQAFESLIIEKEHQHWNQYMTSYDDGVTWLRDGEGNELIAGAGYIQQTAGANTTSYVPGVSNMVTKLKDTISSVLVTGSYTRGDQIMVHTGAAGGYRVFHEAMQSDFQQGYKTLFYSPSYGEKIQVGDNYGSYKYNGFEIVLAGNMLFEDRETYTDLIATPYGTMPKMALNFFIMPLTVGGEPNVVALQRKSVNGKINRDFVYRKFNGMISLDGDMDQYVHSSVDGYREEILCEHGIAVFLPQASARVQPVVGS